MRGYIDQLYAISFWTGLPWLWQLSQPTLVLAGDDDPIVPVINGRILATIIPNARLEIIHGGGHLFPLERPTQIAAIVAGFLAADRVRTSRETTTLRDQTCLRPGHRALCRPHTVG